MVDKSVWVQIVGGTELFFWIFVRKASSLPAITQLCQQFADSAAQKIASWALLIIKLKGASAKRSPLPWRAGKKKQPVSPGAAYRAASTNSESPYWRLAKRSRPPAGSLETLWDAVTNCQVGSVSWRAPRWSGGIPMLPPDHYGCGLGCARFTGTLAAVEEHERYHCHFLHDSRMFATRPFQRRRRRASPDPSGHPWAVFGFSGFLLTIRCGRTMRAWAQGIQL